MWGRIAVGGDRGIAAPDHRRWSGLRRSVLTRLPLPQASWFISASMWYIINISLTYSIPAVTRVIRNIRIVVIKYYFQNSMGACIFISSLFIHLPVRNVWRNTVQSPTPVWDQLDSLRRAIITPACLHRPYYFLCLTKHQSLQWQAHLHPLSLIGY
jgi:hypothetical protein